VKPGVSGIDGTKAGGDNDENSSPDCRRETLVFLLLFLKNFRKQHTSSSRIEVGPSMSLLEVRKLSGEKAELVTDGTEGVVVALIAAREAKDVASKPAAGVPHDVRSIFFFFFYLKE